MKLKMAADQVLKRFSRQIRKEDAIRPNKPTPYENFRPISMQISSRVLLADSSTRSPPPPSGMTSVIRAGKAGQSIDSALSYAKSGGDSA